MIRTVTDRSWPAVLAAVLISTLLLWLTGLFSILFLFPLQVLFQWKGKRAFITGSLGVVFILGMREAFVFFYADPLPADVFNASSSLFAAALLLGLIFVNTFEKPRLTSVSRMLVGTAAIGILSIPVIILLSGNSQFMTGLRQYVAEAWKGALSIAGSVSFQAEVLSLVNTDEVVAQFIDALLCLYMFFYFGVLALNWRIGTMFSPRVGTLRRPGPLLSFHLGDRVIWVLLTSWTVIFVSFIADIGMVKYIFWNIGLMMLFLYGLQGLGIVNFLIVKYASSPFARFMIFGSIIFLAVIPGANVILLVLLPLLGISEVWIAYRKS